jgi:hypothetical protein
MVPATAVSSTYNDPVVIRTFLLHSIPQVTRYDLAVLDREYSFLERTIRRQVELKSRRYPKSWSHLSPQSANRIHRRSVFGPKRPKRGTTSPQPVS